ncbi:MAG: DEAD/DEAH box helicase family protein [Chloroflexi bacterium]|nr:DEAD/DEAH box helicase family protein [Chloroflexota bacterium]MCC6891198.1 DEAD/DEAH box helicase family protein [Anaerolineae bacterium]
MRGEFVALDLETTGLDSTADAIIEFGAVRFQDGIVTAEYSTLINPGRPIPPEITTLTGIKDSDFLSKPHKPGEPAHPPAPSLNHVLPAIQSFVGNAPIIGHNIGFDLGFLYPHGLFQNNLSIDTYDLAAILLPAANRYSLSSLSQQLKIELTEAHRALHDARASALLYWEMWKHIQALPYDLVREIVSMSQGIDWNARIVFEYALEQMKAVSSSPTLYIPTVQDINTTGEIHEAAKPETTDIDHVLGSDGTLAKRMAGYEARPGQVEMAQKISEAFNSNSHLLIEAGTGIGKSLAYLVPSILWATQHKQRVVISTNTLNLQEQLIANDIPLMREIIATPFDVAVLKGRSNYLCLERLTEMRRRRPATVEEVRVLAKILVWLTQGGSGQKSDINIRGFGEQVIWQRLSADEESCTAEHCAAAVGGKCPYHRARKLAESADVVIVNHALLLADTVSENNVIPDYQHLIIDEAHHLEEAATNSVSNRLDESAIKYHLHSIGSRSRSTIGELIEAIEKHVPLTESKRLLDFLKDMQSSILIMDKHIANLFAAFRPIAYRNDFEGSVILRINDDIRQKAEFGTVREQWTIVSDFLSALEAGLQRLPGAINRLKRYPIADLDNFARSIEAGIHYLRQTKHSFEAVILNSDPTLISWIHANPNYGVSVNTAPSNVGSLLEQQIWSKKQSVVLTSATLQTNNGFGYIQNALGTETFETAAIGSPFNYRESTLVFIPNDMPDPNERGRYQQGVERAIIELAAALDGRTLALFTSYTQLQQTAQAIRPRLALGDITVYDQLDTNNRQALLENFKTTEKAVLLGTKSFWEGIDIPGSALSALVLTKLPFPIPTDPIVSARSEVFKDPFNEYTLPETILRFRQGFGRLIRKQSDRGIVVLLDKRLMSKSYGQSFLDALPDCTIQYGTLQTLPAAAQKWLNSDI